MDDPRYPELGIIKWGSPTNADGSGPAVYALSDNDVPNIRNGGAPELTTKFCSSFDPEPHWLDDPAWYDDGGLYFGETREVKVESSHPGEVGVHSVPGTNADRTGPAVYVFSTDDTRNTGAPELTTNFRSAFDPEPHSLDGPIWDDDDGRSSHGVTTREDQHGLCLDSTQE